MNVECRRPAAAGAAALLIALTVSARARADDRVSFTWEAPPGCPSSAVVEATIRARLGAARVAPRVDVRGGVKRDADGFRVRVSMGSHERTLVAPSCAQAAEAVAVIVAVAIEAEAERARTRPAAEAPGDGRATAGAAPAGSAPGSATASPPGSATASPPGSATASLPTPTPPAATDKPEASPPPSPPSPPPRASSDGTSAFARYLELGVGVAVDSATLPGASPGVAVSADWRAARWLSLGVVAAAFLPRTGQLTGEPAARATVFLADAVASACVLAPVALGTRELDLGACVGAGAGLLPAESSAVSNPSSGLGIRPELWGAGRARLPLSRRFALRFEAGPLVDPSRPPFEIRGIGVVHRPAMVTFRAVLGVGFIFP